jgi:hypothetical protein
MQGSYKDESYTGINGDVQCDTKNYNTQQWQDKVYDAHQGISHISREQITDDRLYYRLYRFHFYRLAK